MERLLVGTISKGDLYCHGEEQILHHTYDTFVAIQFVSEFTDCVKHNTLLSFNHALPKISIINVFSIGSEIKGAKITEYLLV